MSSVDLNIIERGLKGQEGTAEKGPITAGDLAKISEQRTNNSSALNALPTPFARFFVVKEAFRRALEELKNPKKIAGDAYNRLVSDTLDIFELLYKIARKHKHRAALFSVLVFGNADCVGKQFEFKNFFQLYHFFRTGAQNAKHKYRPGDYQNFPAQ